MRQIVWVVVVAMVSVISGSAGWSVAEEAPAASDAAPAPTPDALSQAPAAPAPMAPVMPAPTPAAPDLKPIVIKFSGEIVQVNQQDAGHPTVTVRDRYGVTKEMNADAASIASVNTGDQVTVEYTYDVATGKRQVQTVSVTQAAAAPAATQ